MLIRSTLQRLRNHYFVLLLLFFAPVTGFCQFTPVTITGFNHDVVAETGTSSLTTTTTSLDGVTVSNKVMYTVGFKTTNAFGGGGIPDNGSIVNGTSTYQLAAYNANNALVLPRSSNADLTLATPAKYDTIRILCFATEGSALVNVQLTFTDATTTTALTNYTLGDWFNGTTNLVLQGFGRCTRATPASGADAYSTNPRLYYIQIPLSCADKQKTLQKINLANVTTAGSNAPYPNAVFFAVSGKAYTQTVIPTNTPATCTTNGSATLTVTGSSSPYTISWNTTPVQTGITASNLPAGNYIATITDAASCTSTFPVTIAGPTPVTLTAHIDTSICSGASFSAGTISNGTTYSWSPTTGVSNPAIANPTLSPTATTTYTVTATLGTCSLNKSFTVTVVTPTFGPRADTTLCFGGSFSPNITSNATGFAWTPTAGVSNPAILNPVLSPAATTQYSVTGTIGACSVTRNFTVNVIQSVTVNAGPDVYVLAGQSVQLQGSGSTGTYLWTPSTGLSATNILNPTATIQQTTTYTLKITTAAGCNKSDDVIVTVVPYCVKPMNAFTPNGDGQNDLWLVSNGPCLTKASVAVFNRWGSKVYESKDYKNNWNGTFENKALPDGTYYYIINYELINNTALTLKGNVTILR